MFTTRCPKTWHKEAFHASSFFQILKTSLTVYFLFAKIIPKGLTVNYLMIQIPIRDVEDRWTNPFRSPFHLRLHLYKFWKFSDIRLNEKFWQMLEIFRYLTQWKIYTNFEIFQIFGSMKNLRVLTLTGNPVIKAIPSYRKALILQCVSCKLFVFKHYFVIFQKRKNIDD